MLQIVAQCRTHPDSLLSSLSRALLPVINHRGRKARVYGDSGSRVRSVWPRMALIGSGWLWMLRSREQTMASNWSRVVAEAAFRGGPGASDGARGRGEAGQVDSGELVV